MQSAEITLPEDIQAAHLAILSLQNSYDKVHENIKSLQSECETIQQVNQSLQNKYEAAQILIKKYRQMLYGAKSEKRIKELLASGQLFLNEDIEKLATEPIAIEEVPSKTQLVKEHERKSSKKELMEGMTEEGIRFDETKVEVVKVEMPIPQIEGLKEEEYEVINTSTRNFLMQRRSSYYIKQEVYRTVKIKETQKIIDPLAPYRLLDKSYADTSYIVGMLIQKFSYHLPLYRQHQMLLNNGIKVARGNLTLWTHKSISLLEPIYEELEKEVLLNKVISMDETPIKVKKNNSPPGKLSQCYYWPIVGKEEIVFKYSDNRGEASIRKWLKDYDGTITTDGFVSYDSFVDATNGKVKHSYCWAHARREFCDIQEYYPEEVSKVLDIIGQLYQVEQQVKDLNLEGLRKKLYRQDFSTPIADKYFTLLKDLAVSNRAPKDALLKAINYSLTRMQGLKLFIEDPDVPIDNNHTERQIRNIVMGRKNWLFCWTEVGAEYVGIIQSLLCTCKILDIDAYDYLTDVFDKIHDNNYTALDLTPKNWKKRLKCKNLLNEIVPLQQ